MLGPLFYRALETNKIVGLKRHRPNYNAETELPNEACSELFRWKHNIKNSFQYLIIPTLDITLFTNASKIDWGITDGHNPSGGQWTEHERVHINVLELKATLFARNAIIVAICLLELCQTALQQLHILITNAALSPKNAIKLQKEYGFGVLKIIFSSLHHTYQENTILKLTYFLENLTLIENGNIILRYLLKLLISWATQKLIFFLPE